MTGGRERTASLSKSDTLRLGTVPRTVTIESPAHAQPEGRRSTLGGVLTSPGGGGRPEI